MVIIPLHDYEGNLDEINSPITIKDCYWTGKTFRFTCAKGDDKNFFCYAVHPELPKVHPEDWTTVETVDPYLWGSEIDSEILRERILRDEYYFTYNTLNGRCYLNVCGTINELRKKAINDDELDKALVFYGAVNQPTMANYIVNKYNDTVPNTIRGYCETDTNKARNTRADLATGICLKQNEYELLKGKEQKKMNGLFDDIKVGKASREYSITYFGTVAFRGKTYYNGKIFDATGMTINFDMLYLVPASEVKEGDIVDKNGKAYYVKSVNNGVVNAIDLLAGTEENLVPGGPFGMTLYSKIFNPFGSMKDENAFGNMLMLQALNDKDSGNNGMLMAMMMMQGGFKLPTFEMPNVDLSNKETK